SVTVSADSANGTLSPTEVFLLSDEQILEIDPVPQDEEVSTGVHGATPHANVGPMSPSEGSNTSETRNDSFGEHGTRGTGHENRPGGEAEASADPAQGAQTRVSVLQEPPAWLAAQMNDAWNGAEARALWERTQNSEREAAAYREVFAKPE